MIDVAHGDNVDLDSGTKVLYFTAAWCGPCKRFKPVLEEFSENHEDVTIYRVDVDNNPSLTDEHDIRGVPALVIFRDGEKVNSSVGAKSRSQVEDIILA